MKTKFMYMLGTTQPDSKNVCTQFVNYTIDHTNILLIKIRSVFG